MPVRFDQDRRVVAVVLACVGGLLASARLHACMRVLEDEQARVWLIEVAREPGARSRVLLPATRTTHAEVA